MGVYTKFSLRVHPEEMEPEIRAALVEISRYDPLFIEDVPPGGEYANSGYGPKWYDCKKHCEEIAQRYPDAIIRVASVCDDYDTAHVYAYKGGSAHSMECEYRFGLDPRELLGRSSNA
jgi:hypothetical protein